MKQKNTILHTILTVVLFGAIWGLLEATIGYLLHWLPSMVSGLVMFPIGATLMYWAFRNTDKKTVILYVGLIAAAIKAINLLMPLPPAGPIKVINPMISIVLQSLIVFGLSYLFDRKTTAVKSTLLQVGILAFAIVAWRGLFLVNQAINYGITGNLPNQLKDAAGILSFIFVNGGYEFLILGVIYAIYRLVSFFLAHKGITIKGPEWIMYVLSPLALVGAVLAVVIR
ncbi:MAG: hypothetical protein WC344_04180 [Bacilli bacterium]|jgi:hypothetical protein